ncbi:MAG: FdtA/QdtA family cupin domain-containing protein [Bacteroidaceae bacterium]|jgi:dTDP-4-dehydrorhamnose 3,5-epimerase-like enzyme|nr:FdtA/QdtA family cupin domain-containing protein [Bacteroidaceae bacterium]
MDTNVQFKMPKGCKLIELPLIADERGALAFGECRNHIPFKIERVFWTYNIKDGLSRGNHAHRTCSMVIFPLGGSFKMEVDDGEQKIILEMNDSHVGILIPPLVWCKLYDFTRDAACVSLASEPYSAEDYIHDYNEFKELTAK